MSYYATQFDRKGTCYLYVSVSQTVGRDLKWGRKVKCWGRENLIQIHCTKI